MIITCPSCNARFRLADDALGEKGRRLKCSRCQHSWHQAPLAGPAEGVRAEEVRAEPSGRRTQPPGLRSPTLRPPGQETLKATSAPPRRADPSGPTALPPRPAAQPVPDDPLSVQLGDTEADRRARFLSEQERPVAGPGGRGRGQRLDLDPPKPRSTAPLVVGWLFLLVVLAAVVAGAWYFRDQVVTAIPEAARLYAALGIEAEGGRGDGLEIRDVLYREEVISGDPTLVVTGGVFNSSTSTRPVPTVEAVVTDAGGQVLARWRFRVATLSLPPGGSQPFEARHPYPNHDGPLSVTVDLQEPRR